MVLLSMLTFPFRCVIIPDAVDVLEVVMAILEMVLLLMFENGNPMAVENLINRGVGVPVAPPV